MTDTNQRANDRLEEGLWLALMCRCSRCGRMVEMGDIEHLLDANPSAWAEQAAVRARSLGWMCNDAVNVSCNRCS